MDIKRWGLPSAILLHGRKLHNVEPDMKTKIYLRQTLLSSGEFTCEAVINTPSCQIFESSPQGLTLGLNEASLLTSHKDQNILFLNDDISILDSSQEKFDEVISSNITSQITTALSLVFLKYGAHVAGFHESKLFSFVSKEYKTEISLPVPIFNILNGGKHAGNGLEFCEFMIIPKGTSVCENIRIASEVYLDLRTIIEDNLGVKHTLVGREGGFAPDIFSIHTALELIVDAINIRNRDKCNIAIDVAANNFSEKKNFQGDTVFEYKIGGEKYSSIELVTYYKDLLNKFPYIVYLEDVAHEEDIDTWIKLKSEYGNQILIVGDDLTVTNINYLEKYKDCINACILKVNQIGTFSDFMKAYLFCKTNGIITIISQRSGETDSNILTHIATGLGSNYIKAGAPARERIVKYNTLLRLEDEFFYDNK